jgi:hypothetical protein
MSIELIPLGTLTITTGETTMIPNCPAGTRLAVDMKEVRLEGERVSAALKGVGAGDWLTIGPEGTVTIDMRFTLLTKDGAAIYTQTGGRTDASKGPGGAPLYMALRFETGDARYSWLNKVQAIGKGQMTGAAVSFEVYELK